MSDEPHPPADPIPDPDPTTGKAIGAYLRQLAALLDAGGDTVPVILASLRAMCTDEFVAAMGPSRGDVIGAYLELSAAHDRLGAALGELAEYMEGRNAVTLRRSNTN